MIKYPSIFIAFLITCLSCAVLGNNKHNTIPKPDMVYVNGGSFTMGNIYGDDNDDAKPTHTVKLNNYRISKYEVTYNE